MECLSNPHFCHAWRSSSPLGCPSPSSSLPVVLPPHQQTECTSDSFLFLSALSGKHPALPAAVQRRRGLNRHTETGVACCSFINIYGSFQIISTPDTTRGLQSKAMDLSSLFFFKQSCCCWNRSQLYTASSQIFVHHILICINILKGQWEAATLVLESKGHAVIDVQLIISQRKNVNQKTGLCSDSESYHARPQKSLFMCQWATQVPHLKTYLLIITTFSVPVQQEAAEKRSPQRIQTWLTFQIIHLFFLLCLTLFLNMLPVIIIPY